MFVQSIVLVNTGGKVTVALVHYLLNVGADLLVVTGDVSALGVVRETVDVFAAVVVDHCAVSATLVSVVKSRLETILVDVLV